MSAVVDEEAGRRPASTRRSKRPDPTAVPRPRLSRCPWYRRKLREQEGGRVRTSAARGAAANGAGASRWRSARHRRPCSPTTSSPRCSRTPAPTSRRPRTRHAGRSGTTAPDPPVGVTGRCSGSRRRPAGVRARSLAPDSTPFSTLTGQHRGYTPFSAAMTRSIASSSSGSAASAAMPAASPSGSRRSHSLALQLRPAGPHLPLARWKGLPMSGASIETDAGALVGELRRSRRGSARCSRHASVAASAAAFLDGLLGPERRKTGWMRAEAAGDPGPWRQQAILGRSRWDADALRDLVRDYALETLADAGCRAGASTRPAFSSRARPPAACARQYTGSAGKITNCQIGVFAAYVSDHGHAFIDRRLYLPKAGPTIRPAWRPRMCPTASPSPPSRRLRSR